MNKVAVVTGAGSGIGRAIADRLLEEGWSVAAFDRDSDGLEPLRSFAGRILTRVVDITDPSALEDAFAEAEARLGAPAAVIGAAGIWTPGTVSELTDQEWDRAISVNLTGMFNTARAAVRHMSSSGGGAFVAVASDVGVQGSQGCAAYVAAKHGVVGLVRAIALDHGAQGIRVNAVCPGFVETPMTETIFRDMSSAVLDARRNEVPLGRFAQPSEIAGVVGALVSADFSFVNGSVMLIDGGSTAGYYTMREQ